MFGGVFGVVGGVDLVAMGQLGVMRGAEMIARRMVFGGFGMMMGGKAVMVGCLAVMMRCLL